MTIYPDDRDRGTSPFDDLFDQNRLSDLHQIEQAPTTGAASRSDNGT